jgi:hypothetical protein
MNSPRRPQELRSRLLFGSPPSGSDIRQSSARIEGARGYHFLLDLAQNAAVARCC